MASSSAILPLTSKLFRIETPLQSSSLRNQSSTFISATPFLGSKLNAASEKRSATSTSSFSLKTFATVTIEKTAEKYTLPPWTQFELGKFPVFWETANGRPPASGELLTLWFNPSASNLSFSNDNGVGFNGGFNSPIMCGGTPRSMTRKERGPQCAPFYTIKINVPTYATSVIFSFTDGQNWSGPYTIGLEIPAKWRNLPSSFFNEALAKEMEDDGACEAAIFPDSVFIQDRCFMPKADEEPPSCELDISTGCTDPDSPNYDPLARVDDGSCPII